MHALVAQVATTIRREKLATSEQNIIIAISGGADSVALLIALSLLGYPLIALHANFALRGRESDEDEAFVVELCRKYSIPLETKRMPTTEFARDNGVSIEMAARTLRYEWFFSCRHDSYPNAPIAVAHNSDDQIETALLNLSKGTGIRGLSGMPYRKDDGVIRPLLDCSREDILSFLDSMNQSWREDSSNLDIRYQRNLIRHKLIPLFEQLNPNFRDTTSRTIEQLRDTEEFYLDAISSWRGKVVSPKGISLRLLCASPAPSALLYELLTPYHFSPETIRTITRGLPRLSAGNQYYSSTHRLICSRDFLELFPLMEEGAFSCTLELIGLCGQIKLPRGKLYWRRVQHSGIFSFRPQNNEAIFDFRKLEQVTLTIRGRKEGDKLYPYGMTGAKKLRRIFIDNKYTHRERQEALLLCSDDEPIWLIGRVSDRRYRVTEDTTEAVIFLYRTGNGITTPKA